MPRFIDITGQRFGRLVAFQKTSASGPALWLCQCDCGNSTTARTGNLRSGNTRSCGCGGQESRFQIQHGRSRSRTYSTWVNMLQRCNNPNEPGFKYYGARGITVCERWRAFESFFADMGEKPPGLTIERLDNDRGYEPGNCVWATRAQQMKNRRKWKNSGWKLRRSRIRNVAYIRKRDL